MDIDINAYSLVIGGSLVIIFSYFANVIAKKTNIPSVLLLIILGIGIQQGLEYIGKDEIPYKDLLLEFLGTVGLIFIVLEAALDLELKKEKWPIIWKSFVVALGALILSSFAIAYFLHFVVFDSFLNALVYAIPLSIMSSAIIIPSVGGLVEDQKEFMVYESTFSDILGILFFYQLLGNMDSESVGQVVVNVSSTIGLTILLGVLVSYGLVFVLQKINSSVKLFLIIAVLLLIYAVEKLAHLSPLILILIFGLMLNNHKIFFRKKMANWVNGKKIKTLTHDFHVLTLESAFVIRTFFFVIFGASIVLSSLLGLDVLFFSLVIVVLLYAVRLVFLWIFKKKAIFPLLYIAPRGLITILLYFQIQKYEKEFVHPGFDEGILLLVIMVTSLVMTISLIQNGFGIKEVERNDETSDFLFLTDQTKPTVVLDPDSNPSSSDIDEQSNDADEDSSENDQPTSPNDHN
ncbi:MAG: cation:proton antiporter [Bacteroidota bacterium]